LKDLILNALDKAGGEEYLVEQTQMNPAAFMTHFSDGIADDIITELWAAVRCS